MLLTLIVFLLVLSILIFVHEFGHFVMAKLFGMYVEEFGFGLPPRVWGKKVGETIYSLNLLPIGGFVKLYGEEAASAESSGEPKEKKLDKKLEQRAFYSHPKWQRAIVLIAGVGMNFLLAVVIISYIFTQGVFIPTDKVHIDKVLPGSPAEKAGLAVSDVILSINNVKIKKSQDLISETRRNLGKQVKLVVERKDKSGRTKILYNIFVTPRKVYPAEQGPMGVAISNLEEKKYPWYQAPILGMKEAIFMSWELVIGISFIIWRLITFTEVPKDVAGPVGIAQLTGQAVKFGWMAVLQFLGLLSLNLAVINILPIPALDGGRLLFVGLEPFIGKKIRAKVERAAHQVGMAFLLSLIILVTLNDVARIVRTTQVGNLLRGMFQ